MGVGHRAERNLLRDTFAKGCGETIGVAANENKLARSAIAEFAKPFCKSVGIEILASGVEEDCRCGAICVEFLDGSVAVANLRDLDGRLTADAFHAVVDHRAHFHAARFAEHEQAGFHFKPYFLRFSRRVLRLMPSASAARLIL